MIYDIQTYNLKTGSLHEYWKRFCEKLPERLEFSKLVGHWYTEVGLLNQMVSIWPYEDLNQRSRIRREVEASLNLKWPPDTNELIVDVVSNIYHPASFMTHMSEKNVGPIYEMRLYTYPVEAIRDVLSRFGDSIAERERLSPMVGCWYSEHGGVSNFVHMWAYKSFDERLRIRKEALALGIWPPSGLAPPIRQENKILLPAPFSPMQ